MRGTPSTSLSRPPGRVKLRIRGGREPALKSEPLRFVTRCVPEGYGTHRYLLEVRVGLRSRPRLAVILKNPSTASASRSDPTVGKVEAWARRAGYGSVACVNLFALRATRPEGLNGRPYRTVVGPENDRYILEVVRSADFAVAAWGNPNGIDPKVYGRRVNEILRLLKGRPLHIVGPLTKQGHPRHGLRWNGGLRVSLSTRSPGRPAS